jgi:hypothetical protein
MEILIAIIFVVAVFWFVLRQAKRSPLLKPAKQLVKELELSRKEFSHLKSVVPQEVARWKDIAYIDFCAIEALKLYVSTIRKFPELLQVRNPNRKAVLAFRYCIWQVQCKYDFKVFVYGTYAVIPKNIIAFIDSLSESIPPLTEEQEKRLNTIDSSRWKRKFDRLSKNFKNDSETFYNEILKLASHFGQITVKRAIFLQAHQFMANKNREISAMLYIHYLSVKSKSATFKFTGINARNKKVLFRDKKQESEFEKITEKFKADNDLEKALEETKKLLTVRRKTIQLNVECVDKAQQEYKTAVGILNKYLADEEIPESVTKTVSSTNFPQNNTPKNPQEEFLEFFVANNYKLTKKEVNDFAAKQGTFASLLINNINETHYEELNDVLIEEMNDYYTIDEMYYRQIYS